MLEWLEAHDKLAGWAQFLGAVIALGVTYLTAFVPIWRRKRQMEAAGARLLDNGYEAVESVHRTLGQFIPSSINLRTSALIVGSVVDEIGRFPIYELDDQGSRSIARNLVAIGSLLSGMRLLLETTASDIEGRLASVDERDTVLEVIGGLLKQVTDMRSGAPLKRPVWPNQT